MNATHNLIKSLLTAECLECNDNVVRLYEEVANNYLNPEYTGALAWLASDTGLDKAVLCHVVEHLNSWDNEQ